jgi:hypothetical protein
MILINRQEIVALPRVKLIMVERVLTAVKVTYNEPKFNQHNEILVRGVPMDWSRVVHSVNRIPRPHFPFCTYYHWIRHQTNECPFIEDNVKQGFVEHFQKLNPELVRVGYHGHIELEGLYHEKVRTPNKLKEQFEKEN